MALVIEPLTAILNVSQVSDIIDPRMDLSRSVLVQEIKENINIDSCNIVDNVNSSSKLRSLLSKNIQLTKGSGLNTVRITGLGNQVKADPSKMQAVEIDSEVVEVVHDEIVSYDGRQFDNTIVKDEPKNLSCDYDDELTDLNWLQDQNLLKTIETGNWPICPSPTFNDQSTIKDENENQLYPDSLSNGLPLNVPYNPFQNTVSKPPYSFSCLIFMAIEDSEEKKLPVKDIYKWIQNNYPFFRNAPTGWRNSVRHNLSLNKCFMKVEKDRGQGLGKGSYWCVDPQSRPNLLQALRRTPYHPYHQMQMISSGGPQQLSPISSGQQSANSDLTHEDRDGEIPIPDSTDIDVAHMLMQLKREALRSDLAARLARMCAGSGAQADEGAGNPMGLTAILEGLEDYDNRAHLYEKIRMYHRQQQMGGKAGTIICTPHPSIEHSYCVTADIVHSALLISPTSSDIDHDYDFDDRDVSDEFSDEEEDWDNEEPMDLRKKVESPKCKNFGWKASRKFDVSSGKAAAISGGKAGEKFEADKKVQERKSGSVKAKQMIKKPVKRLSVGKKLTGKGLLKEKGDFKKKTTENELKLDDAEAIEGAGALLNLCSAFGRNASSNALTVQPSTGENNRPRRRKMTEKVYLLEKEKQMKQKAAELQEIREEIEFIRRCTMESKANENVNQENDLEEETTMVIRNRKKIDNGENKSGSVSKTQKQNEVGSKAEGRSKAHSAKERKLANAGSKQPILRKNSKAVDSNIIKKTRFSADLDGGEDSSSSRVVESITSNLDVVDPCAASKRQPKLSQKFKEFCASREEKGKRLVGYNKSTDLAEGSIMRNRGSEKQGIKKAFRTDAGINGNSIGKTMKVIGKISLTSSENATNSVGKVSGGESCTANSVQATTRSRKAKDPRKLPILSKQKAVSASARETARELAELDKYGKPGRTSRMVEVGEVEIKMEHEDDLMESNEIDGKIIGEIKLEVKEELN